MLLLKLTLVPLFLLAVSLVAWRWGPRAAGRLAGLPVVTGPVLAILVAEHGADFGVQAANGALACVPAVTLFVVGYAQLALRGAWPLALVGALAAWAATATLMLQLPPGLGWSLAVAALALWVGPHLAPRSRALPVAVPGGRHELWLRMAAGALLTLVTTSVAEVVGGRWSGLLSVFPLLSTVMSVSIHRRQGGAYVAAMLRAMLDGLLAFAAFCVVLVLALPRWPMGLAFGAAVVACLLVQAATGRQPRGLRVRETQSRQAD